MLEYNRLVNYLLGLAIVQGMASHLGVYQYKCSGGQWIDVNISNTIPVGSSPSLNVLYLKQQDEIRFQMKGNPYWTQIQASRDASFSFLAWDMTNDGVCKIPVFYLVGLISFRIFSTNNKMSIPALA